MQLFEGYSADELHRVLTTSRWIAGVLVFLAFAAIALNQWLVLLIASQQKLERNTSRTRLIAAEEELRRLRNQLSAVANSMDKMTSTRKLPAAKVAELNAALANIEKGKVLITYLTTERDAEDYAKQLAKVLTEAGYEVTLSDHLWVSFDQSGLFLTSKEGNLPEHGKQLQGAFSKIGVDLPGLPPGEIGKELVFSSSEVVLVVSGR